MSWLLRLLSPGYRAARKAEAAGRYREAAQRYVEVGADAAAAHALLFLATRSDDITEKTQALRDALRWTRMDSPSRRDIHAQLGLLLFDRFHDATFLSPADRLLVADAAKHLELGERYAEAVTAHRLLKDEVNALRVLQQSGDIAGFEAALDAKGSADARTQRVASAVRDYEAAVTMGARPMARAALLRGLEQYPDEVALSDLLRRHDERRLRGAVVWLREGGERVGVAVAHTLTVGRADADLCLRSPGVSRAHLALHWAADPEQGRVRVWAEDLGSQNGTRLMGMPIRGRTELGGDSNLALGPDVMLHVLPMKTEVRVTVTKGVDRGLEVRLGDAFTLGPGVSLGVDGEGPVVRVAAGTHVVLNGQRCVADVALLRGDLLVVGEASWEVEG